MTWRNFLRRPFWKTRAAEIYMDTDFVHYDHTDVDEIHRDTYLESIFNVYKLGIKDGHYKFFSFSGDGLLQFMTDLRAYVPDIKEQLQAAYDRGYNAGYEEGIDD